MKETAEKLKSTNVRLKESLTDSRLLRAPTETERQVVSVASEYVEAAEQIVSAFKDLSIGEKSSHLKKIHDGLKAVWNQEKLTSLQQELKDSREQLVLVVLLELR